MKPSTDVQLGAKRAIDTCSRLIRNSGFTSADVLENAEQSSNMYFKAAAVQLEDMSTVLRADVARWLETGTLTGFLSNMNESQLRSLLREKRKETVYFEKEEEKTAQRKFEIPALDMSSLRIDSPNEKQPSSHRNTPSVSDIRTYEDIEVVEVSDSSAFDSQLLNQVADKMLNQLQQVKPVSSNTNRKTPLPSTLELPKPSLNFIPSSPLSNARNTFTKSRETAVQTSIRAIDTNEMIDAATSYDMYSTHDEGEVSTSDSSDPSFGQVSKKGMSSTQVVSVRRDGSVVNPKTLPNLAQSPRVSEVAWKAPLEMIRIAERDISSSFGSERIETVSANHSARGTPSMLGTILAGARNGSPPSHHSDDEPTVNQVSQINSEISDNSH